MADAVAPEIRRFFEFALELDRLKAVERRIKPLGLERFENSAEHSWHLAVVAMVLSRWAAQPVDLARVLEILLVHDIPEIDSGDFFVYSRDAVATARSEEAAAERIFGLLPEPEAGRFLARWREFEERRTPEARLAYAADRLVPVLQNLFGTGQSWRDHRVSREQVRTLIGGALAGTCPEVWQALEPMIDAIYDNGALRQATEDPTSG